MGMYSFTSEVWLYPGNTAWHFISVPKNQAQEIREIYGGAARGFGSLPVRVTIGKTIWNTSIFLDAKSGTYLLPLKAVVRKVEKIEVGKMVAVLIEMRV